MATPQAGVRRFYAVFAVLTLAGLGILAYLIFKPQTVSIPANVVVQASDTTGFRGYLKGSPDAPVEITEFADFQCPFCQTFATLQMPTIDERLIQTGRVRWRYRDFPLQQHPFARLAAHSAACADEQGKYWDQHQRIYEGQSEWSAVRDAGPIFRNYAKAAGLDLGRYDACMKAGKYAGRIQASYNEGVEVGVNSTPTLLIGNRLYKGRFDSDAIIKMVDSLAPRRSK
ncbi:MAG TPA: thioredoxin domain-containing protein [Gemmatimonadales bacterium]|nr:thioredoxin domain-containing protein [Gemmatimonadales bacterium]